MRVLGQLTSSATTRAPLSATTYTEPTVGAQRSFKSNSASDAAAGTGARTVRIRYYTLAADGTITGPFFETVTLNGTSAVATVATNIALIESIEVLTAGSGAVAAGIVSLYVDAAGGGGTIVSIAAGAVRTFSGVHYVPTGYQTTLTDIVALGGGALTSTIEVVRTKYPLAVEQTIAGPIGINNTAEEQVTFPRSAHSPISGPARVRLFVTPGSSDSQLTTASFGYVDQRVAAY